MMPARYRRFGVFMAMAVAFGILWWLPASEWADESPEAFPATIGPFSLFDRVVCLNTSCIAYGQPTLDVSRIKVLGCSVCRADLVELPFAPAPPAHQRHQAGHYLFSEAHARPVLLKIFRVESLDLNVLSASALFHLHEQGFVRVSRPEGLSAYIGRVGRLPHRLDIMTNESLIPQIGRDWDDILIASWYGHGETATPHRTTYLAQELWRRFRHRKAEPLRHTVVWTQYDEIGRAHV